MAECSSCGRLYYPTGSNRWGSLCGECLAREVELSVLNVLQDAQRKPPRRAIPRAAADEAAEWVRRHA